MNIASEKNKSHITIALLAASTSAVAAALGLISLFLFYDSDIGYYQSGAVIPMIFQAFLWAAVIGFGLFCLFGLKGKTLDVPPAGSVCRITALLPVAAFALLTWNKWQGFLNLDGLSAPAMIWALLAPILSLGALAFFVSACVGLEPTWLTGLSGILTVFMFAYEMSQVYLDMTVAINSPRKLLLIFALISAAIYMTSELRVIFNGQKPRLYLFSSFCAALLTGAHSIPSVIYSLGEGERPADLDIALLTFFIFVLARLISLAFIPERKVLEENRNESGAQDAADATENGAQDSEESVENTETQNINDLQSESENEGETSISQE